MPELDWYYGYPFALALMVGISTALYVIFKSRNWLMIAQDERLIGGAGRDVAKNRPVSLSASVRTHSIIPRSPEDEWRVRPPRRN